MNGGAIAAVAERFLFVGALHHLVLAVTAVVLWQRRRGIERAIAVYFSAAFATSAACTAVEPATRIWSALSLALAALWVREAARPEAQIELARVPRPRVLVCALAALFAVSYPGYTGELPAFIFSPLGVLPAPTLLAALAATNLAPPRSNRPLHWSLVAAGALVGILSLPTEEWAAVPLLALSVYGAILLSGRARLRPVASETPEGSVRQIRDRMYTRKTLLPGPHDPRRRINIRRR